MQWQGLEQDKGADDGRVLAEETEEQDGGTLFQDVVRKHFWTVSRIREVSSQHTIG